MAIFQSYAYLFYSHYWVMMKEFDGYLGFRDSIDIFVEGVQINRGYCNINKTNSPLEIVVLNKRKEEGTLLEPLALFALNQIFQSPVRCFKT